MVLDTTSPGHGRASLRKRPGKRAGKQPGEQAGKRAGEQAGKRAGEQAGKRAGTQAGKQAGERDPFLDNAKYLTIVLVGVGHAWQPMRDDSRVVSALYLALYAFHMPVFTVISGYLSRGFEGRPRQIGRLVTGVAVPYLVFQTLYVLFMRLIDDPHREFTYLSPGFALWFLVALFLWRLSTPLWKHLRRPLPVAVAIAVAAGVMPGIGGELSLMRVAQFLPFFVLGLRLRPGHFRLLGRRRVRLVAGCVLVAAVGCAYGAAPRVSVSWFLHDEAAQDMGVSPWTGAVANLAALGLGVVLTGCFLAWVPRRRRWFSTLGAGTLCAYLLHVYPVKLSRVFHWYDADWVDHPVGRVAVTLLAAATMTLLCTPPVRNAFRLLTEPTAVRPFRRKRAPEVRAREPAEAGAPARPRPTRAEEP